MYVDNELTNVNYRKAWTLVLASGLLFVGGCTVALKSPTLNSPAVVRSEQLAMNSRTEGIDGKVGWGRFTLFAIPIVPIYITGDDNAEVAGQIQRALEQAGYSVTSVEPGAARDGAVLRGDVEKFRFSNYTWFFPIVPTWGNIDIKLTLESKSGESLWSRAFHGGGSSLNFFNGYTSAANKAMTTILNDMVTEFASEDFHRVLTSANGAGESAS